MRLRYIDIQTRGWGWGVCTHANSWYCAWLLVGLRGGGESNRGMQRVDYEAALTVDQPHVALLVAILIRHVAHAPDAITTGMFSCPLLLTPILYAVSHKHMRTSVLKYAIYVIILETRLGSG